MVTADNGIAKEIKGRIKSANRCIYSLHNTIKSKSLTQTSKIRIYKWVIRPVLMYGYKTFTLTKETERKLRCFEKKISRRIFLSYQDIVQEIKSQRLRWAGHVHRLPNNGLAKLIWKDAPIERRNDVHNCDGERIY
ncbi:unnamed protein product, partial [Diabrotica balteata]